MKTLAIIPARGGSKGVPGKNIRSIHGKALIEYSIEVALAASEITEVIVSSDSLEILSIAAGYPQITIHQRAVQNATDTSPITDTIREILELRQGEFDMIMLLQPTSPLRTADQLNTAVRTLQSSEFPSLISVCKMDDVHPARMYWLNPDQSMRPIMPEFETFRRQDNPPVYYRNGSIYLCKVDAFWETGKLMIAPSMAFQMPADQLLNIDSERDMLIAEVLVGKFYHS